ncbi:MAG: LysM peptidoglycan-binding domain-containing protein, partial [Anaerolineae bacterium]|nr:LysM peptidoglycan-binding domain-containing protein [Anaerolineae bacterium]
VCVILLSAFSLPATHGQPSGYDLAAAVNAYRAANGYYQLNPHSLVMAAAQAHADWIVETGQGGHIGASGSDETIRVSWTGYGGGATIRCDENWTSGRTIEDAVYDAWSDWTHQEVMLNAWGNRYTDIGGGAAAYGDGRYAFVLNVCLVAGQESGGDVPEKSSASAPLASGSALATADSSNYIYGVTLATPLADGTIKHKVLYGQTLASIAKAYGITIETLRSLNDMTADNTIIWVDEELLIQPAGTAATYTSESTPAETVGSPAPSVTPIPTHTPQPTSEDTAAFSPTPQVEPADGQRTPTAGIVVIGLAGIGLAVSLYFSSIKK